MISTKDLLERFPELLSLARGQVTERPLHEAAPVETGSIGHLVFAGKQDQLSQALANKATAIVAAKALQLPEGELPHSTLFQTPNVGLAMAAILPLFEKQRSPALNERHPTAAIHPTAKIGKDVSWGPFVCVGPEAVIGDGCRLGPNTVVEDRAVIGPRTRLHAQVHIGRDCVIGSDCEIYPHVTIGGEGFGYAQDKNFHSHKLPQLGRVVLGDRVEVGSGTVIDRAAFTETKIGSGTKIDNLCHIAHNCEIGEDSLIAGGFMTAGSTKIGARFMTGGSTVVADHLQITDGVMLAGRSTVTNDITKPGAYGGYPLAPMKEHLKTVASLPHLVKLRKQVSRILKHLNLNEEESP